MPDFKEARILEANPLRLGRQTEISLKKRNAVSFKRLRNWKLKKAKCHRLEGRYSDEYIRRESAEADEAVDASGDEPGASHEQRTDVVGVQIAHVRRLPTSLFPEGPVGAALRRPSPRDADTHELLDLRIDSRRIQFPFILGSSKKRIAQEKAQ